MGVASAYHAIYGESNAAEGPAYNPPPQQFSPVS
jgi:hypothetical protein